MFTLLSEESVFDAPKKAALYISFTGHVCALIALTWFSLLRVPTVRFELMTVHAGTAEPVRQPQQIYSPIRNSPRIPSDRTKPALRETTTPPARQTDVNDSAGFTPTPVPSEFLALLETDIGADPAVGLALAGMRTLPPLIIAEPSFPPLPEPPPGEPDIKPPLVIGGRVEPAELIKQTIPVYPHLARTARVEGVVALEGTVNVKGNIENLHVVSGHPLLIDAAVNAVKKWKYRPAKLNGQLTPCPVTIQVRFTLQYPESGGRG
jgi:TonB family protein